MAKLSRKKSIRVSFLLAQMTLTDDQSKREEILRELIESLGIDAEQSAESLQSAARYLRYMASKKRREERQSKPVDATGEPDIDSMSLGELQAYNRGMMDKIRRILEERRAEQHPAPTPDPAIEDAPQYDLPTKRMEQAVARFDDLADDDQLDQLRQMWGCTDGR